MARARIEVEMWPAEIQYDDSGDFSSGMTVRVSGIDVREDDRLLRSIKRNALSHRRNFAKQYAEELLTDLDPHDARIYVGVQPYGMDDIEEDDEEWDAFLVRDKKIQAALKRFIRSWAADNGAVIEDIWEN